MMRHLPVLIAACLLAACALTPEQQAQREAERVRQQQNLQIALAGQCDQETAGLMRQQFDHAAGKPFTSEAARQDFRLRYIEKVNDPLFQACYQLAWKNHVAQQRLYEMERYRNWHDDFGFYYPWYRPFGRWYR